MTKLYLRNGTPPTGTPTTEQSAALPNGTATGTPTTDPLSTAIGDSSTPLLHTFATTADTAHRDYPYCIFGWTIPVALGAIAANTWTFAMYPAEGNAQSNGNFEFSLYVYRPGTGVIGYIWDVHDTSLAGLFREFGSSVVGRVDTISGSAVSGVQANDLLVLEMWVHHQQAMTTSYTTTLGWNGATDATDGGTAEYGTYISTPQDLETAPSTPISGSDSATATDEVTAKNSAVTDAAAGDDTSGMTASIIGGSFVVPNPSVESGPVGFPVWYASWGGSSDPGPVVTRVADGTAPEGSYVGVMSQTISTAGQVLDATNGHPTAGQIYVTPGAVYVLTVWVKASRANQEVSLVGAMRNAGGTDISYLDPNHTTLQPGDGWVQLQQTWMMLPTAAHVSVAVRGVSQAATGELFRFDLFQADPIAGDGAVAVDTAVVAAGTTPITASDTAVGDDASALIAAYTATDSGSAADTAPTLGKTATDAAVGADTAPSLGKTVTDAAVGADASLVTVPVVATDAATATESIPALAQAVTDTATSAESIPALAQAVSDTAVGLDTASLNAGSLNTGSDTGTANDASALTAAIPVTDTGSAVDSAALQTGPNTATITSPLPSLTQAVAAVSIAPLVPVFDSFDRADAAIGTSTSGHTWIAQSGTWNISTNRVYRATSEMQSTVVIDSGFTTCSLSVDAILPVGANDAGVVFAASDDSNYLLFVFESFQLRLWKRDAGTFTLLAGPYSVPNYSSTTKRARVEWDAATGEIELWFDSVQVTTVTLGSTDRATYAVGTRQGLRENATVSDQKTYFDNYSLTPPAMPALSTLVMARSANTTGWSDPASDTTMEGAGTQVIVVTAGV